MDKEKRFTIRNPGGQGYRINLDKLKETRIMYQRGSNWLFGDIANRLGELEDKEKKTSHQGTT